MWIFTNRGFLSVVADRNNKTNLLVRARFAGDIEAIFGDGVKVKETPTADYRFRASIHRMTVADAIINAVAGIGYDNFKDSVKNSARKGDYMRVWSVMHQAQEREVIANEMAAESRPLIGGVDDF